MKETIEKAVSLAFGLATVGREQTRKIVDELVKKGEMTREESKIWLETVASKGKEAEEKVESAARERFNAILRECGLVTKEEWESLKKRVEALEQSHQQRQ